MTIVVTEGRQTLFDISIQQYGTADFAFDIAYENDMSVSDTLMPGVELIMPNRDGNLEVLSYYKSKEIKPATGDTVIHNQEGIDYWTLESDFEIQ